jgi:hypothetical protein
MKMYNIHIPSFLHTEWFGTDTIVLPESEGLHEACLLINKLCADKKRKEQENLRDEYLAKKYRQLKVNIDNGQVCRDILREISEYELNRK